jgi:ribonuclease P/MRP protein subunit RPP1
MKRVFTDLHLKANPKDMPSAQHLIERAAHFGYHTISIPLTGQPEENQTAAALKTACKQAGIDFVSRADFKPRSQEDLMRFLRRYRRKLEIISIICDDKEIARQAAKDRRVDLLSFPSLDYHKRFFDRAEAELASSGLAALEVDVKPLLVLEGPPRVRLLSSLRREIKLAHQFHVPLVISSGVSEARLMRMPRDLASLGCLFGLNETEALNAVSTNPTDIIHRNREKLDSKFVAPGISVVKEGSDP